MGARFRSWWQQIKQHSFIATGIIVVLVVAVAFILSAYRFGWSGTGFLNKSLWDWLQLLIIPLALAVIALVFQLANARTERQIAKERYEQDQQIALDKQHEDLLQAYLDRMSELLLKEKLRSSEDDAEVRNVARVRTITVLTQLDARRIGYVFAFLREAGLMSTASNKNVVSLKDADLRRVNWSQANLLGANLSEANLSEAILSEAILGGADLNGANLLGANLSGANLSEANLSEANLNDTNLRGAVLYRADLNGTLLGAANLIGVDLSGAYLSRADLSGADLSGAYLSRADLSGADLSGADLSRADLSRADLSGTDLKDAKNITIEELEKQAGALKGATMPDGSIHP